MVNLQLLYIVGGEVPNLASGSGALVQSIRYLFQSPLQNRNGFTF